MKTGTYCIKCGKELNTDDIGAHKKLINRGAVEFYCVSCLAEFYKCDVGLIKEKIEHFKNQGCQLFK